MSSSARFTSITNIVLRFLGVIFPLVAFSLMASANNGSEADDDSDRITYASFSALKYVIAANVVACFYSALQVLLILLSLITKGWIPGPVPWLFYATFLLDQVLAYLLFSCSSSGATAIDMVAYFRPHGLTGFYSNAAGSVALSFMAAFVFMVCTAVSGYHFVKSI